MEDLKTVLNACVDEEQQFNNIIEAFKANQISKDEVKSKLDELGIEWGKLKDSNNTITLDSLGEKYNPEGSQMNKIFEIIDNGIDSNIFDVYDQNKFKYNPDKAIHANVSGDDCLTKKRSKRAERRTRAKNKNS